MLRSETAIRTTGLTKAYGEVTAVAALDLQIGHGEVFGLLGPNGAGKTTTILMLLGLSEPTAGTVRVLGMDPTRDPLAVKRAVGYLPDNVGFYATLTGRDNLRYTARLNGLRGTPADQRVHAVLTQVGLAAAADAPAGTYSRGMRQRLGVADALVKDPRIVILDEPTIAIDPEGVEGILALIRELAAGGVTVLLASHLLQQVQSVCDRVGIFVGGRMVAQGAPAALAEQAGGGAVVELGVAVDEPGGAAQDRLQRLVEALRAITGVADVEPAAAVPGRWRVTADRDVRRDVVAAVDAAGLELVHLRRRGDELEEIYRRWFAQDARSGDERVA